MFIIAAGSRDADYLTVSKRGMRNQGHDCCWKS
jgi:hypothetical protein